MRAIDLSGQRFGKLVVVELLSSGGKRRVWRCSCDCGNIAAVTTENLRSGNSEACGRCRKASPTAFKPVHGASVNKTPTYKTWQSMRARVHRRKEYAGVTMAPEWDDFATFLRDMGERPEGMTIDRKDNALGYSKENCRWATPTQQTRNRRIARVFTWNGRTMPIAEWARELGITYGAALGRINRYNSLELPSDAIVRTFPA